MPTTLNADYTVTEETFESIASFWLDSRRSLSWDCLFVLPAWLKAWWGEFGSGRTPYLWSIRHQDKLIGIAPLMIQAESARLMGDSDVCDYLDFIVTPGRETSFFEALLGGGVCGAGLG